ncbi:PqiC family protein [Paraburkholderia sprentiae WSM5005]|uniref:PqiC family protein n=1 Tax=Paraburkholderia sprentiae WSM5005 TaxID=754502 RepID=A0A1I9YQX1_9BURK|nr:PqiC family protein [Paraburkholderia sprentiae]APA88592.1 PqiC family protein [Paraburkholderia sprentiae WSM5005]
MSFSAHASLRAVTLTVALALSACASTPVHYHTLVSPAAQPASAQPAAPFAIDVLPVGVPAELDQQAMVVRQGDSGVAVLDGERWVAPLGDELRAALSAQLVRRLGTQDVAGLARPINQPVVGIRLQIRRLDAWPGHAVQLEADWSLGFAQDPNGARLTCHTQLQEAAPGGYADLVRAQQLAIASLAGRIAEDARGWAQSRQHGCTPQA